jgi:pimeloyl-ACP methyl ester carboxylesterase
MIRHRLENGMHVRQIKVQDPEGTILYIHGLGESGLCFEKLMADPQLRGWSHLAPDLPGYGKSPWPDKPLELDRLADYLCQWLESMSTDSVLLLGHSMGGVVGLMISEKCPELLCGFVNVEGNVSPEDCTFSAKAACYSLQELLSNGLQKIYEMVYRDGLEDPALRTYYASLRLCDPRAYHLNSKELVFLSRTEEIAARIANLKVPCVYILGNPRGTGNHSRYLLSEAGVRWRVVEDAGHWPFIDQQDSFIADLMNFMRELPPS